MTREEEVFFKKIEEESKNNPMARINAASNYITGVLANAFTTKKGLNGNQFVFILSTLTGVAVAKTAKEDNQCSMSDLLNNPSAVFCNKLETDAGIFWVGDKLNKYLYEGPIPVWGILLTMVEYKHGKDNLPKLEPYIERTAKRLGDPNLKLWNGDCHPYKEREDAGNTYESLRKSLEPFKLKVNEYYIAFAMSLANAIMKVEDTFPKKLNCFDMSVETMLYFAHMDY